VEFGIYGWVKGLDLKSGRTVWTGRNIGPDADMRSAQGPSSRRTTAVLTWCAQLGQ